MPTSPAGNIRRTIRAPALPGRTTESPDLALALRAAFMKNGGMPMTATATSSTGVPGNLASSTGKTTVGVRKSTNAARPPHGPGLANPRPTPSPAPNPRCGAHTGPTRAAPNCAQLPPPHKSTLPPRPTPARFSCRTQPLKATPVTCTYTQTRSRPDPTSRIIHLPIPEDSSPISPDY
jgi:hypothetical protein